MIDYFHILRSEAIGKTELLGLSLLQTQNKRSEWSAIIITLCQRMTEDTTDQRGCIAVFHHKNSLFCLIDSVIIELFYRFKILTEKLLYFNDKVI